MFATASNAASFANLIRALHYIEFRFRFAARTHPEGNGESQMARELKINGEVMTVDVAEGTPRTWYKRRTGSRSDRSRP